jgi:two-component system, NtrC family, sensor kinase
LGAGLRRAGLVKGEGFAVDASVIEADASSDPDYTLVEARRIAGFRTMLGVPLLREDEPVGVIMLARRTVRPFTDKQIELVQTFADQAAIAIGNVRLFDEVQARTRDLTEALEQQTATSEVLGVISSSPGELGPVFNAMLENAVRICGAGFGGMFRCEGGEFEPVAYHNVPEILQKHLTERGRIKPRPGSTMERVFRTKVVVHVEDLWEDPDGRGNPASKYGNARTYLGVPMLKDNELVGAIVIFRQEVRPFTDKQIELVSNFAKQAVIAIENTRLLSELRESLQQQTATADVLKVISRSAFEIKPVFATLIESAVKLCGATRGFVSRFDGELLRFAAGYNVTPELREYFEQNPFAVDRHSNTGRAALERRTVHNIDVRADPEYTYGGHQVDPYRTVLAIPMLKADELLGVIVIYRHEVQPFTDSQIALMETFADQAVIAIENARLFDEVQARTQELTETLEYQTATGDVLNVISRSLTDIQPVFDMIAESAARLCEAQYCFVYRFDGQLLHFVAHHGLTADVLEINRRAYPAPPSRRSVAARAILEGSIAQIPDVNADPDYALGTMAAVGGYRSAVGVPILRDGRPIGSIAITRAQAGLLPDRQIELLKTFADQAAIAIENARLFDEV